MSRACEWKPKDFTESESAFSLLAFLGCPGQIQLKLKLKVLHCYTVKR